jgi:serine/threonine protein phosphatase 1
VGGRTFAIGDIHGDLEALNILLTRLPELGADDSLVFLGDYVDRGPDSAGVVSRIRTLKSRSSVNVVTLRGNHEDAWLQVVDGGWPEFVLPRANGCLECYRSFTGAQTAVADEAPSPEDMVAMLSGKFLPADVIEWMRGLPFFFEDEHAIYVHAGIKRQEAGFPHPSAVRPPRALLWLRDRDFFENYRGKLVVFGHTTTRILPTELSSYTPDDPLDMWAGPACVGLDTACGKGGFLTALELPARKVYESRS